MRICLLTYDLAGPVRNGGIGTAFLALATQLAADGHEVSVVFPGDHTEAAPLSEWTQRFAAQGIHFEPLFLNGTDFVKALAAAQALAERRFDIIHYHEWRGIGFFLAMARLCGLAFQHTALVCQLHSPTDWHRRYSSTFRRDAKEAGIAFMERRSAELADLVFSPSQYLLDWVKAEGWHLPTAQAVHPNLLPQGFAATTAIRIGPLEEPVFFGRLEERKGLDLFCTAITRLVRKGWPPKRVTFLGKVGHMAGEGSVGWIARAARDWPMPWEIRNDLDVLGARAFLAQPGRFAVIASTSENSPYTVLECLAARIPFLAAEVGGVAELILPEDRPAALFPRNALALSERMAALMRNGRQMPRPAIPFADNIGRWQEMQQRASALAVRPAPPAFRPLVSICVSTFSRPLLLAETLAALEAQTYPNIEVVLTDDASPDPHACAFLDALAPRFAARGWKIIRKRENAYLGAARNTGVQHATGDWLLFVDDDNLPYPEMVERFVMATRHSGASVLTCMVNPFAGELRGFDQPVREPAADGIFLGGPASLGLLENCFGDASFLIRRDVFQSLGGFTTERAGFEDWELLLRACLAGHEVICLPELLYHYRVNPSAMLRGMSPSEAYRSHDRLLHAWDFAADGAAMREALQLMIEVRASAHYARDPAVLDTLALNRAPAFRAAAETARLAGNGAAARLLLDQAARLAREQP